MEKPYFFNICNMVICRKSSLETTGVWGNFWRMSTASVSENARVAERLVELEKQFAELRALVLRLTRSKKDWRSTVGMMPDDEVSRSGDRLGREWREAANRDDS